MTRYHICVRLAVLWAVVLTLLVEAGPARATCGSWTLVPSPNGGTAYNFLYGVAAVSSNDVWAVGTESNAHSNRAYTLIEHWNGANWSVVASPNGGTAVNELWAISAASAGDIWAVGDYYNVSANAYRRLIEHYDGTSWSIVPSPDPGIRGTDLYGVAAISSTDVWAIGDTFGYGGGSQTLIEHWDGTSWSVVPSPNPGNDGGSELRAVSAVSASDIWAVGDYLNVSNNAVHRLIEHWDGTRWSIVPSPDPGTQGTHISGVAAVSPTDVWAVGDYTTNVEAGFYTLIEHWNGTSWSIVPGPTTYGLNAVAAASTSNAWAVGGTQASGSALIEHWNGTSWSVVPSAYPAGLGPVLNGVTVVPGASEVWAIGNTETTGNTFNTLIEHYC